MQKGKKGFERRVSAKGGRDGSGAVTSKEITASSKEAKTRAGVEEDKKDTEKEKDKYHNELYTY